MVNVNIQVIGFGRLHFERRELRSAIRKGARVVVVESRRLIARRAVSAPGEAPGYDTGTMSRAVKTGKVGSGGLYARVQVKKTAAMGADFYPAYLIHGTRRGIEKRDDFVKTALTRKRMHVRNMIRRALINRIRVLPSSRL